MIENEARGWHGSYSSVGRISAEMFPIILFKDQIIEVRYKKKKIKDYFSTEEDLNNKLILDEGDDIFNVEYKTKIKLKKRKNLICKPDAEKTIPEEYKYHNLHHKDLFNYKNLIKNQSNLSSTAYDPKKEFVWSKTLTGPQWSTLCGREKGGIFKLENCSLTPNNKLIKNENKNNNLNTFYSLKRGVIMNKMTERGIIPTYYDLRIRNDKPFNEVSKTKPLNNNTNDNNNINSINKKEINQLNIISDNDKQSTSNTNNISKNNKLKKNIYSSPNVNHALNFAKNLSREQYNFIKRNREGIRPFFNPKYDLVEPRSLTMVSYNKKSKGKSMPKRLIGVDINLFYDPDKIINKINNHRQINVPLFKYMSNKCEKNGKFPSHMLNIHSRSSLEMITGKTLKMNNYAKVDSKNEYSTFCQKKSFNKIINYELLKNEKINEGNSNFQKLAKIFGNNKRIKNLMEFYTKNFDDDKIQYTGDKFDSITLKSMKSNGKLNKEEKELFSINLTN